MKCFRRIVLGVGLCIGIVFGLTRQVHAQTNLVVDGTFTNTNGGINGALATTNGGQMSNVVNVVGWSNTAATNPASGTNIFGFNMLFTTNMVNNSNVITASGGAISLWNNVSASNGFSNPPVGNFIAMDGAYQVSAVTQTLTNLGIGEYYYLSFYWAAAQETGYTSSTTENLTVSLGGESYTTATITNPSKGFSGWYSVKYEVEATNTTEVLSFLAGGTPVGQPPFSLLSDVQLVAVPEASNVITGIILLLVVSAPLIKSYQSSRKKLIAIGEEPRIDHPGPG